MIPPLSLIKNIHIVEVFLNKEAFTDKICKGEIRIALHSCLCPLFQCKRWTLAFSAAVKHLTRDTCFLCCNTTIYTLSSGGSMPSSRLYALEFSDLPPNALFPCAIIPKDINQRTGLLFERLGPTKPHQFGHTNIKKLGIDFVLEFIHFFCRMHYICKTNLFFFTHRSNKHSALCVDLNVIAQNFHFAKLNFL
jgi:hypothetical protein